MLRRHFRLRYIENDFPTLRFGPEIGKVVRRKKKAIRDGVSPKDFCPVCLKDLQKDWTGVGSNIRKQYIRGVFGTVREF